MCVAASLAASASFGVAADRQQAQKAQAQVLDHAEFLCDNCFFGASDYYYCMAVDNKILVGYQRTPVLNWQDSTKNYLVKEHPAWSSWAPPTGTVAVSYDDKHIWISLPKAERHGFLGGLKSLAFWASRGDSKEVRLKQSAKRDIFIHNDQCRGVAIPKAQ